MMDSFFATTPGHVSNHRGHRRQHAAGASATPARADLQRAAGEARGQQPGRIGQGSARPVDGRRGGEARDDQTRRHAHRSDLGQHRHRAGDGRRDARLPDGAGDARAPFARAPADDARVRRRDRAHAQGGRYGDRARRRREDARRGQGHHPRPVRQSRQSAVALSGDGPRNLARHRGAHHALRLQHGHDRHHHGRRQVPEGEESGDSDRRLSTGGRLADPRYPKMAGGVPAEDL